MAGKLTPKQGIFIAEYTVDRNATRAALAAGVPLASASVTASRWLKVPAVATAIATLDARRLQKLDISAERVLQEIAKLAYYDNARLYDENGARIPVHQLDEMTRAAVASVEDETTEGPCRVTTRTQKIKMADRLKALELLGRHQKLFTDKVELGGKLTLEQLVCGEAVPSLEERRWSEQASG